MSDYLENKLIDWLLRGQAFTPPATVYIGLLTAAPTDAGGGTEVAGGAYARAAVASSLANWAGTQAPGSTVASTGTNATTSNNGNLVYPAPTGPWGQITHVGVYDASTAGNLLFWAPLTAAKNVNLGDPAPSISAGALGFQFDN